MSAVIRSIVRRTDSALQSRTCLVLPLFVDDPRADSEAGIYSAEDWDRNRLLNTEPFRPELDRYGSDEEYCSYLAAIHESKILSVQSLIRTFDFSQYNRIIELGCGDMPQAYTIWSSFPDIAYTATDFDRRVIEKCSQLPMLRGICKSVFDVVRDDLNELKNHDLVISWSLEFSLNNMQLTNLFAACKKNFVPYLLCTHTTIGPFGYFSRARSQAKQRKRTRGNGMQMLGWLRSTGEIARLAGQEGMVLRTRSRHINHTVLLFTPT